MKTNKSQKLLNEGSLKKRLNSEKKITKEKCTESFPLK